MAKFLTRLRVESQPDGKTWVLTDDLLFQGNQGDIITIKKGTRTDFATVPQWLQSIFPKIGAWTEASVLHDELIYRLEAYHWALGRWEASKLLQSTQPRPEPPAINSRDVDGLFRLVMKERGVNVVTRWLAWAAVRWAALFKAARRGGWLHWPTTVQLAGVSAAALMVLYVLFRVLRWVL